MDNVGHLHVLFAECLYLGHRSGSGHTDLLSVSLSLISILKVQLTVDTESTLTIVCCQCYIHGQNLVSQPFIIMHACMSVSLLIMHVW